MAWSLRPRLTKLALKHTGSKIMRQNLILLIPEDEFARDYKTRTCPPRPPGLVLAQPPLFGVISAMGGVSTHAYP